MEKGKCVKNYMKYVYSYRNSLAINRELYLMHLMVRLEMEFFMEIVNHQGIEENR